MACGIPARLRPRSHPAFGALGWRGLCLGLALSLAGPESKRKAEVAHPLADTQKTPPPRMACLFEAWLSLDHIRQPETAGLSLSLKCAWFLLH